MAHMILSVILSVALAKAGVQRLGSPLSRTAVQGNFYCKSNGLSTLTSPPSRLAGLDPRIHALCTEIAKAQEDVDAHGLSPWAEGLPAKPGQGEVIRPISSLVRSQNFPGQPCAFAGMTAKGLTFRTSLRLGSDQTRTILPGFRMPSGSSAILIVRMTLTASPCSAIRKSILP